MMFIMDIVLMVFIVMFIMDIVLIVFIVTAEVKTRNVMYTVNCKLYCTLYAAHCTVQFTVYSVQCVVCSLFALAHHLNKGSIRALHCCTVHYDVSCLFALNFAVKYLRKKEKVRETVFACSFGRPRRVFSPLYLVEKYVPGPLIKKP